MERGGEDMEEVQGVVLLAESDHAGLIATGTREDSSTVTTVPVKKKRGGNKIRSGIWALFTKIDQDFAICKLCESNFSYRTSTSNLKKHMITKHSIEPPPCTREGDSPDEGAAAAENITPTVRIKKEKNAGGGGRSAGGHYGEDFLDTSDLLGLSTSAGGGGRHSKSMTASSAAVAAAVANADQKLKDEFDAIGVTIAAKLRKMEDKQRLFCEKVINDAMFKAALDQLGPTSELVIYTSSPELVHENGEGGETATYVATLAHHDTDMIQD